MADTDTIVDPNSVAATTPPPAVDWASHVPTEYAATFEPYKGKPLAEVFKGYGEAAKMIGAKPQGLKIPDEKATPEERAAFDVAVRKATGVPDDPKGYKYARPDVALDGAWDEAAEQGFLGEMHKAGASSAVVNAAMAFYGKFIRGQLDHARSEALEAGVALRAKWGANYDASLGRANLAVQEIGGDALVDRLDKTGLGRDPIMVEAWAKVGDMLVEHGAVRGEGVSVMSPEESTEKVTALYAKLNTVAEGHPSREGIVNEIIRVTNAGQRGTR